MPLKNFYKFEKIKQLTHETIKKNPNIKLIDMGVGEPDKWLMNLYVMC